MKKTINDYLNLPNVYNAINFKEHSLYPLKRSENLNKENSAELIFGCIFYNPNNLVFGIKSQNRINDGGDEIDKPKIIKKNLTI